MNNARQIISVVSEMEGTLIAVLGDLSIYSRQDTWDGRDVSLFGAGMGLVLKAVEIECGRRALREMNELEEEKVLPVIEKVALLPGRHKAQREVGDIFPPFPPGQTLLNETIGVLGDIICDNPAERFVLESGAVGTYYIIEEASEWVQGIKKAA
jgi:hypothetical protein